MQVHTSAVAPWGYLDKSGRNKGILTDFMSELCNRAAIPCHQMIAPYPRVIQSVSTGYADAAILFVSDSVAERARLLGIVADVRTVMVGLPNAEKIHSLDDLKGKRVGVIRASYYGDEFDQRDDFQKIPLNSIDHGLYMLIGKRIDVIVSVEQTVFYGMRSLGMDVRHFRVLGEVSVVQAGLYISKASHHNLHGERLRHALLEMKAANEVERFFVHHENWVSKEGMKAVEFSPLGVAATTSQ
nr:transporter substrate-binding domain-containing protein [Marinibactrum halimedae]